MKASKRHEVYLIIENEVGMDSVKHNVIDKTMEKSLTKWINDRSLYDVINEYYPGLSEGKQRVPN